MNGETKAILDEQREKMNNAIELSGKCIGIAMFLERACARFDKPYEKYIRDELIEIANDIKVELGEN